MIHDRVDLLGRNKSAVPTFMPGLTASTPTRPLPTRTRRHRRRVLRRRQRRVPRAPVQPPLELSHPSLEPLVRLDKLADTQQQRNSRLAVTIQDRLGFGPLHTSTIRQPDAGPSTQVNAYPLFSTDAEKTVENRLRGTFWSSGTKRRSVASADRCDWREESVVSALSTGHQDDVAAVSQLEVHPALQVDALLAANVQLRDDFAGAEHTFDP
jgi:hypothetical protein